MKPHQLVLISLLTAVTLSASAQGTAFTYQGQLQNNGSPATGIYDLRFTIYDAVTNGHLAAGPVTNTAVGVTNGLFTVLIDFGPGAFTGQANWLEIAVATNGVSTFSPLAPRQQLTPVPYAVFAESTSALGGTLSASQLTSVGNTNGGDHHNFFVGPSGNSTMTGWQNTANGVTALQHNTGGYGNTADGFAALLYNTNGNFNTANGVNALQQNASGSWNTANGGDTLFYNTSGNYNTANGGNSLVFNTSGSWNAANGFQALFNNTSGWFNTANGANALLNNSTGNNNTADGFEALYDNTTGSLNTASGNNALLANTTGSQNTANGAWALLANTTGSGNTASGSGALYNSTSGSGNIALGYQAGYNITTGSSNIDIGNQGLATDTNIIRIGSGQAQTFIAGVVNGNGAGLTSLNAGTLTGVIPLPQMPAAVLTNNETGVMLTGTFNGNGSGLTSLDASQLTSIGNNNGGYANFFVGPSGNATMSGWGNTANGDGALVNNTSGTANLADGNGALNQNTSGDYNTASGYAALYNNTIGWFNTANGSAALGNNTEGFFNTAIGFGALYSNISGNNNTAIGYSALNNNTNGNNNVALGYQAGINLTGSESGNIVIGNPGLVGDNNIMRIGDGQSQAFIAGVITGDGSGLTNLNVTVNASQLASIGNTNGGSGNFFVGESGNPTNSGSVNTANGYMALLFNTSGTANTANGYGTLVLNTNGSWNTADGVEALWNNSNGSFNTAVGCAALIGNTSGSNNIALGYFAGLNITTGSSNIDIGNQGFDGDDNIIRIGDGQARTFIAGVITGDGSGLTNLNVTANASQLTSIGNDNGGSGNFFIGESGNPATGGFYNTAIGSAALSANTSGDNNTACGGFALSSNTVGSFNTAIGLQALLNNTSGSENTAGGLGALYWNKDGSFNTANGVDALFNNASGNNNTAFGSYALFFNTNGNNNTGIGYNALLFNRSGSNNIALGYQAAYNITTGSSNIDIGNEGLAADNNTIRIGKTQTATYLVGTVYANGVALTSDRNAKENFTAVNAREILAKVASLPVTQWNFKADRQDVQHIGPMAQDFQAAFQLGTDAKHISVMDEGGVALAAIQGLNQKLEQKETEITELKARLQRLEQLVNAKNQEGQ